MAVARDEGCDTLIDNIIIESAKASLARYIGWTTGALDDAVTNYPPGFTEHTPSIRSVGDARRFGVTRTPSLKRPVTLADSVKIVDVSGAVVDWSNISADWLPAGIEELKLPGFIGGDSIPRDRLLLVCLCVGVQLHHVTCQ